MPEKVKRTPEEEEIAILSLLGPNREIDLRIQKALEEFSPASTAIMLLPKEKYELRFSRLLKYFQEQGNKVICVTVNKSAFELSKVLQKELIPFENVFFIDAVTIMVDGTKAKSKQITYLESPSELTELSICIEKAVKKFSSERPVIIIDSLTTLLVYNPEVSVEKFTHTLSQKVSEWNIQGVFLATDSTSKKFIDTLSQFCDRVEPI